MSYRVLYTDQFHEALEAQLSYFTEQATRELRVANWLNELLDLMDSLDESPKRFPVADLESSIVGLELRQVVFGNYLAFYSVNDKKREVQLLGLRHAARRP